MIDMNKIRNLIREEIPWGNITPPADFTVDIDYDRFPAAGDRRPFHILFTNRVFRFAASALALLVIGVPAYLLFPKGEKAVFTYPYNGEKTVELIGSMNNWNRRVKMSLDPVKKEWVAVIRIEKKGIYEYQFIVDQIFLSAGDSVYRVRDSVGNEKAVLILSRSDNQAMENALSAHYEKTGV